MPAFDLDHVVYDTNGRERAYTEIVRRIDDIRAGHGWVTEGAYQNDWLPWLLDDATAIVWLDTALPTALVRMLKRHVRAELSGNNPHSRRCGDTVHVGRDGGLVAADRRRRLTRFLNYTRQTAAQQRTQTTELLSPYSGKVIDCRSSADVASFNRQIVNCRLTTDS